MLDRDVALVVDTLMGLLACSVEVSPADWSRVLQERSARAWHRVAELEGADDVAAASCAIAGEVWEALAVSRPAGDVALRLRDLLRDDFPVGEWCCPYCVGPDDVPVPLAYLGGGEWSCPSCGCVTSSPVDDGCFLAGGAS